MFNSLNIIMKKEFKLASQIFLVLIIMFYISALNNRWSDDRIQYLAVSQLKTNDNVFPYIMVNGVKEAVYDGILHDTISVNSDKTEAVVSVIIVDGDNRIPYTGTFKLEKNGCNYANNNEADPFCINI